jgi:hypothetical protein
MGTGLGRSGLSSSGMGAGLVTSGIGAGLGTGGLGTALGGATGIPKIGGVGGGNLGGLSLAGTQKGPSQGIFTQSTGIGQSTNQQQLVNAQLMLSAITTPVVFADERDVVIKKFNQLEAYCGCGKGLTSYGGQLQVIDFTSDNPFARFKVFV